MEHPKSSPFMPGGGRYVAWLIAVPVLFCVLGWLFS